MRRGNRSSRFSSRKDGDDEHRPSHRATILMVCACLAALTTVCFNIPRPWATIVAPIMADLTSKCIVMGYLMHREGLTERFPLPRFTTCVFVSALTSVWCVASKLPDGLFVLAAWNAIQVAHYVGKYGRVCSVAYLKSYFVYMLVGGILPPALLGSLWLSQK